MKKFLKLLVMTSLVGTMIIGCGTKDQPTSANVDTAINEVESKVIKIKHTLGEVEVTTNPKRVVVLDMGVLATMDELGVNVELALPVNNLLNSLESYKDSVNLGGITDPNLEKIYEFNPDLIISSGRQASIYDKLSEIAPTWHLTIDANNLMGDIKNNYTILGEVFHKEAEVKNLMNDVENKISDIQKVTENSSDKALVILSNDGKLSAFGKGSRFGVIHDVFGVKSVDETVKSSTHGQEANYEYVAKVNPDILYVVDRSAIVGGSTSANDSLNNDLIKSTNAYKNGKIVYLDAQTWYVAGNSLSILKSMADDIQTSLK